jgi:hypothetical protein
LKNLEGALVASTGARGSRYWTLGFDICIRFGGTELESYLEWQEHVSIFVPSPWLAIDQYYQGIKRTGPVTIVSQDINL